uniref:MIF4G domain-containing protein n=1 Tax=Bursaphelenchus xylophilus TaxID=6326 RepID=A0A1I7RQ67_BURXY
MILAVLAQSMINNYSTGVMNPGPRRLNPNAAEFHPRRDITRTAPQYSQPQYGGYHNYASYMNPPESSSNAFVNADRTQVNPQVRRFENNSVAVVNYNNQPVYNYNTQANLQTSLNSSYYLQNGVQNGQMSAQQQQPVQESISQYPLSNELLERIQGSRNRKAIVEVQIGLEQLVTDPSEYEVWSYAVRHRISNHFPSSDIELIASVIVEMACLCPNSQYNFSRLCKALDGDLPNFTSQMIIPKITQTMTAGLTSLNADQVGFLSIFLAELYDKTEVNGVRVARLGQYLIDLIRILLEFDPITDSIVKSAVQVLKLTGRYIEEDQDPAVLNEIFDKLDFISRNSRSISESAKHNIRQLKSLREKQWGVQADFDGYGEPAPPPENDVTMYGPDGQPISEEEWAFLEENCQDHESDSQDAVFYEQFLRDQTEITAISAAEKALEKVTLDDTFGSNR